MVSKRLCSAALLLILLAVFGPSPRHAGTHLRVGIQPYADARMILQHHSELQRLLGRRGIAVELITAPDDCTFLMRARQRAYDLVIAAPHFIALLTERAGYVPVVRLDLAIAPALYVRADAPFAGLDDLRGQRIAMPGPMKFATLVAEQALLDAGIQPGRDVAVVDAENYPNALLRLGQGEAEAAVAVATIASAMAKRLPAPVRELQRLEPPIALHYAVHGSLGVAMQQSLQADLVQLSQPPAGKPSAEPATDLHYRAVGPTEAPASPAMVRALEQRLQALNCTW